MGILFPATVVQTTIRKTLSLVYKAIDKSTDELAKIVADELQLAMVAILQSEIANYAQKYPSHSTGNLAESIMVENLGKLSRGLSYSRVIIDENSAPYAMWVEAGRNAPYGIPYENSTKKNYEDSKFTGHKYISQSIDLILGSPHIHLQLALQIYKNLQTI